MAGFAYYGLTNALQKHLVRKAEPLPLARNSVVLRALSHEFEVKPIPLIFIPTPSFLSDATSNFSWFVGLYRILSFYSSKHLWVFRLSLLKWLKRFSNFFPWCECFFPSAHSLFSAVAAFIPRACWFPCSTSKWAALRPPGWFYSACNGALHSQKLILTAVPASQYPVSKTASSRTKCLSNIRKFKKIVLSAIVAIV